MGINLGVMKLESINKRIYQANIDLVDKNKLLEEDKRILQKRINNAVEFIKETKGYYFDGVDIELIDMLKGKVIVNE